MSQSVSVCVFAGHSGGHLFPAIAFAERFRKQYPSSRISLITSPKAQAFLKPFPPNVLNKIEYLNEFPLFSLAGLRNPSKWLGIILRSTRFLLEFTRAFLLSKKILKRLRPDLCVGFGSYVSYPGMKLAAGMKIPTLIHEQNKVAGKATQRLASQVNLTVFSFPETECRGKVKRSVTAGLPLRTELFDTARNFNREFLTCSPQKPLRILVVGGSQGAHRLNELILKSFFALSVEERNKVAVTHITGVKDFDWVSGEYQKMKMNASVYPFYGRMQELYAQCDFAVTRAGANTLFELALFRLPALAVPFPHAAENHQEVNAAYFESQSSLMLCREEDLDVQKLVNVYHEMMRPEVRRRYSDNISQMVQEDAAQELVRLASGMLPKEIRCQ